MEIKNFYPTGNVIMKNSYHFTVIDENNNIVDDKTYTNISMPKNYFASNVSHLDIKLGIMTEGDKKRYQDADGNWLKGYARQSLDGGGYRENSDGVVASGSDKSWYFAKTPTDNDESLYGTTVLMGALSWSSGGVGNGSATLIGKYTWGYHSPDSSYNSYGEGNENSSDVLIEGQQTQTTYDGQGNIISQITTQSETPKIFGYHFTDGALIGGAFNTTMCTHFLTNIVKRPTDYLKVTVTATFTNLHLNSPVSLFLPEGNYLYAHSCNSQSNSTCMLRPEQLSISGLPCRSGEGGIIPIVNTSCNMRFHTVGSGCPDDWEYEKKGRWFGFPLYQYIGTGNFYQMKIEKDKEGNEKEVYDIDDKGRKKFAWSQLKDDTMTNMRYNYIGPIRSIVLDGFGATPASGHLATQSVSYIKIGVGDGKTRKFFHPFTSETGTVTAGLAVSGGLSINASRITHYNPSSNPLVGKYFEVYSKDWELLCTSNDANKIHSPMESVYTDVGYHPDEKYCNFGLHPFDNNYYPVSGLIGKGQIIVYPNFVGTIGACWVGMSSGVGIDSNLRFITASSLSEIKAGRGIYNIVENKVGNHEDTITSFQSLGCLAITGGAGWNLTNCYVGGLTYYYYDRAAIRITSATEVDGFIEFTEPPPENSNIYVHVNFSLPFVGPFTKITTSMCMSFGKEGDNGTTVK